MMRYYWLVPEDQRYNNWILHFETDEGVFLRPRYEGLQCPVCRKLDEIGAVQLRGIDPDVRIRSKSDFLESDDGFICVSRKFIEVVTKHGIGGISLVALPGDERYMLAIPQSKAPVKIELCGMEFRGKCPSCGRYKETLYWPRLRSVELPEDPMVIVCPEVFSEGYKVASYWFYASEKVVKILKSHRISGIDYHEL